MRSAVATARIESEFRAVGVEERDTPAGRISTIRVEELRWMHDASYRITHWIDATTLALIASQATTVVRGASGRLGHGTFGAPALDYSLVLGSIR
jgi:hypothetical protein